MFSLQAIIEVIISYKEKPVLVGDNHIRLPQFPLYRPLSLRTGLTTLDTSLKYQKIK